MIKGDCDAQTPPRDRTRFHRACRRHHADHRHPDLRRPQLHLLVHEVQQRLAYTNGTHSGRAEFQADPVPDAVPGDAIRAQDSLDDGSGIKAIMTFPESREVSTSGHPSPYTTGWETRDLEEGETVIIRACATKSGSSYCSPSYGGIA
ncbi:hypothetical protein [Streptomyces sp. NPDC019507]|uniref:hypothetical protein n=1 Tax=Streptomyces sp. NPDC019507 TaxID=3154689 RepID=UPI00340B9B93